MTIFKWKTLHSYDELKPYMKKRYTPDQYAKKYSDGFRIKVGPMNVWEFSKQC